MNVAHRIWGCATPRKTWGRICAQLAPSPRSSTKHGRKSGRDCRWGSSLSPDLAVMHPSELQEWAIKNGKGIHALSSLPRTASVWTLQWSERGSRRHVPSSTMHQLWIYRRLRGSFQSPSPSCGETADPS